jgi:hypothetical protein
LQIAFKHALQPSDEPLPNLSKTRKEIPKRSGHPISKMGWGDFGFGVVAWELIKEE